MATLDEGTLRALAGWSTDGFPVTSLHLDVDGRRYARREDYLTVMEDLLKSIDPGGLPRDHHRSVEADVERIRRFVREEFDRSGDRGLAAFCSSGSGLWEAVALPLPVRSGVEVGPRPRLIPLEAMLEELETFCTVVADRERARFFVTSLGRVVELGELEDEVPGWHDQGGWSQARFQRHIKDHVQRHLKRVADRLLALAKRGRFDHLVLAGTEELVADLERELHDYVARRVIDRTSMRIGAGPDEVLRHVLELESRLEAKREAEAVDRLIHEVGSGTGRASAGLAETVSALETGRAETLVVSPALSADGVRCPSCGHLDTEGVRCPACGAALEGTAQLVEMLVESALRQRCRVETVEGSEQLERLGGIGALLRF